MADEIKPEVKAETKAGYKTSEFWLSVVAIAIGAITAGDVFNEGSGGAKIAALITSALVALGYTGARLNLKKD